jgi:hypothetical protein
MHREPGRLVEDQHQGVAMQQTRLQLLGAHGGRCTHRNWLPQGAAPPVGIGGARG